MRTLIATLGILALATLPACASTGVPNSLFDAAGYHVRGDAVFYLQGFPGEAFAIAGADAASFQVLNANFECTADRTRAYYRDVVIAGADPQTFPAGRAVTGCTETSIDFAP